MSAAPLAMLQADQAHGTQHRLLYSYAEARELLGDVPISTFALWIARGLVKPVKIGPRRCFIKYADLLALAEAITTPKAG